MTTASCGQQSLSNYDHLDPKHGFGQADPKHKLLIILQIQPPAVAVATAIAQTMARYFTPVSSADSPQHTALWCTKHM
jgi:hypothetical protein